MSAKEMFEALGYDEFYNISQRMIYKCGYIRIIFDLYYKDFYKHDVENNCSVGININELKAINKQVRELGWIRR